MAEERVPTKEELEAAEKADAILQMSNPSDDYTMGGDVKGYGNAEVAPETVPEPVEETAEETVSEVEGNLGFEQDVVVNGSMDTFFKKLDEMSPQEVYDEYTKGNDQISLEQYYASLENGSIKDFAKQAPNIEAIYNDLEATLNDQNTSSAEKETAQIRLDQLGAIYNAKVEQWDKHKEATAKTTEQQNQTVGVMRLPEEEKENPYQFKAKPQFQPEVLQPEPKEEIIPPYAPGKAPAKDAAQADNTVAAKMDRVAEELQAAMPGVKIERGTIEVQPNGAFKLNPQNTAEAPQAASAAPTVEQPAAQNDDAVQTNPDIELMAKKIRYMNVSNHATEGSAKYVNPEETAQKLYALYGDKASELLHEAIMAPNDANKKASKIGEPISKNPQTLSREAVNYLADLNPAQAKEYAKVDLSVAELAGNEQEQSAEAPAPEKTKQEALKDNLTETKEKNPSAYADLQTAIEKLANGEDIGQVFADLIMKMMKENNYEEGVDGSGIQAFVQDAQTAIKDIEAKQQEGQNRAVETPAKEQTPKEPQKDEYGYIVGSEEAKKHNADLEEYRDLYKTEKEKFKKAKESYEKAAETGEMPEQAKYYLGVIATVEKEEKLREQMQKDQEKASKHIEKLNKKIEKLEKKLDKQTQKGNTEKADALKEELNKLQKEKEEIQKKQGKEGKDGKDAKAAEGKTKDGTDAKAAGKDGNAETAKGKDGNTTTATGKDGKQSEGQETSAAATVQKTTTGNNVIYKIVKDGQERSVNVQLDDKKRIVGMSFRNGENLMTQGEANQFMAELKADPHVDQNNIAGIEKFKQVSEKSGTGAIKYAQVRVDGSKQQIQPNQALMRAVGSKNRTGDRQ